MTLTTFGTKIDLRPLATRERHALVIKTFLTLGPAESVEFIDDCDPKPLKDEFLANLSGRFSWDDLQCGPEVWRARVVKLAGHGDGRCCGSCGGT